MQDDVLFGELTVAETLTYAAMLRLPAGWAREDKLARVEVVVQALGLAKCRWAVRGGRMGEGGGDLAVSGALTCKFRGLLHGCGRGNARVTNVLGTLRQSTLNARNRSFARNRCNRP